MNSTAGPELYARTRRIEERAARLQDRIHTDPARDVMGDPGPMTISARLQFVGYGARTQAYGPTPAQRDSLDIVREEMAEVGKDAERLRGEYAGLLRELDAAGVPWTPGR